MIEINTIISPSESMIFQTEILARSLQKNAGINHYEFNLIAGPDEPINLKGLNDACGKKMNIHWYSKSNHGFDPPYLGGMQRLELESDYDVSLFIDADTIVCGSLAEVCEMCGTKNKMMGVLNIGSPFRFEEEESRSMWDKIGKELNIEFDYVNHQGVGIHKEFGHVKKHHHVPSNYVNYGFVLMDGHHKKELKRGLPQIIRIASKLYGPNFWVGEIALCAAINKLSIPIEMLDLKYNYPDREEFFDKKRCEDIRVLHMVKKSISSKKDIRNLRKGSESAPLVRSFILKALQGLVSPKLF